MECIKAIEKQSVVFSEPEVWPVQRVVIRGVVLWAYLN
jgi:hypothetical protein